MFFWNKNRKIEELEREVILLRDRNDFLEVELTKMNNDLEKYDELDISYSKLSQEIEEDAKRELMKDKDACKKALKNKVHRDKKGRFAKKDN